MTLTDPEVAAQLKLTDNQKAKFEAILQQQMQAFGGPGGPGAPGGRGGPPPNRNLQARFVQLQKQRCGATPRMLLIAHEDVLVFRNPRCPPPTRARSRMR